MWLFAFICLKFSRQKSDIARYIFVDWMESDHALSTNHQFHQMCVGCKVPGRDEGGRETERGWGGKNWERGWDWEGVRQRLHGAINRANFAGRLYRTLTIQFFRHQRWWQITECCHCKKTMGRLAHEMTNLCVIFASMRQLAHGAAQNQTLDKDT